MLRFLALTSLGMAIVGYCIYFDKKRRMDPDYKRKVHERRERAKLAAKASEKNSFTDSLAMMQKLFLEGRMDEVVMQLFTILQYSERPQDVLNMWYKCLPREIFAQLIEVISQKGGLNQNGSSAPIKAPADPSAGGMPASWMPAMTTKPTSGNEDVD